MSISQILENGWRLSFTYPLNEFDDQFNFQARSQTHYEEATCLMKYQNTRGGRLVFQPIAKPETDDWGSPLEAFQKALNLEKSSNKAFIELHEIASNNKDYQMCGK